MSNPFLGEIKVFAGNFAPRGWAVCNGQLLPISQNTALFALLGTTYGGNGQTTFALPDLQNRLAGSFGSGPGLTPRVLGEIEGSATVTLLTTEMPAHSHALQGKNANATTADPSSNALARPRSVSGSTSKGAVMYQTAAPNVQMNVSAVGLQGGSQPHNNLMPYLALNYIIALQGIFPARN